MTEKEKAEVIEYLKTGLVPDRLSDDIKGQKAFKTQSKKFFINIM